MRSFKLILSSFKLVATVYVTIGILFSLNTIAEGAHSYPSLVNNQAAKPTPGTLAKANWDRYGYRFLRVSCPRRFDVNLKMKPLTAQPDARVIFNVQDKTNYYYVQFTVSGVEIGRVESGFVIPIGTACSFGLSNRTGTQIAIKIKRRGPKITVVLDNTIAARAYDASFSGGRIACGARRKSVSFSMFRCQPVGEIYLSDDFMRRSEETSEWESICGRWRTNTLDNPSLSSNAFSYFGRGSIKSKGEGTKAFTKDQALTVIGNYFWDDYTFVVASMSRSNTAMGISFYYKDEENYYLFRWDSADSDLPKKQLIKVIKGKKSILWEDEGGYSKNQWYQLKTVIYDDTIKIYIDDLLVCEKSDFNLIGGKVGLYAEGLKGAYFDDVLVKGTKTFFDDFAVASPGRWIELKGNWSIARLKESRLTAQIEQDIRNDNAFCVDASNDTAKAVSGDIKWQNYVFSVIILCKERWPSAKGTVGLCFHYLDELNYYSFEWEVISPSKDGIQTKRRLVKTINGVRTILAEDECKLINNKEGYHLSAECNDGYILIGVDGETILEEYDSDIKKGRIGLLASNTLAAFDNVKVDFIEEKRPLMVEHEVFSHEKSMEIWAGRLSDWESFDSNEIGKSVHPNLTPSSYGKTSSKTYWHRSDFYRDVEIKINVGSTDGSGQGDLQLVIAGDGKDVESGYNLILSFGKITSMLLRRKTGLISQQTLDTSSYIGEVSLRKSGRIVAAYVNRKCVAHFKDDNPLKGTKLAWCFSGIAIDPTKVTVFADNVYHYTFGRANVDWRVAAGTWQVTNRWQCDPRWSFFSGRSDHSLAALWNKRKFPGDITLEFYAGPKMERERGNNYSYVSDMNATICADGKDLTSGYSFIYGGWNNTATRIMKGKKILAETRAYLIPSLGGSIHRRWFYFKIRKIGNNLEYYIDNKLVLSCIDKDPLVGDRVAIWTYNNGLMVARVRISSEDGTEKEPPITYPSRCESVYSYGR